MSERLNFQGIDTEMEGRLKSEGLIKRHPDGEYDLNVEGIDDVEWITVKWGAVRDALEVRKEMEEGGCHDSGKRFHELHVTAMCGHGTIFKTILPSAKDYPHLEGKLVESIVRDIKRAFKRIGDWIEETRGERGPGGPNYNKQMLFSLAANEFVYKSYKPKFSMTINPR